MHNLEKLVSGPERCTALVHPDDAARLKLNGRARVSSRNGSIELPIEVSDEIMPGVVSVPHGWGHRDHHAMLTVAGRHAGTNSNVLGDDQLFDAVSGNGVLNGIPVELSPV
jgi:anaerobic selenocysteine-containing dehydrogenase